METPELKDKVAVIAGASQGIGEEIARLFAKHGARVIVLAPDNAQSQLEAVAASIVKDGGQAHAFLMDVSVRQKWDELSAWIKTEGWGWDILVNNAYWRTQVPIGEVTDADWDRTIGVSLKGFFMGARAAIPFMLKAKDPGTIVSISSLQALVPEPSFGAYAVAKAGIHGLSRVIARDYGPKIRANTLVPGAVDTPAFAEGPEVKKALGARLPAGRIGYASDIAYAALYLASPRSAFTTGTELIVDGGRSIT